MVTAEIREKDTITAWSSSPQWEVEWKVGQVLRCGNDDYLLKSVGDSVMTIKHLRQSTSPEPCVHIERWLGYRILAYSDNFPYVLNFRRKKILNTQDI